MPVYSMTGYASAQQGSPASNNAGEIAASAQLGLEIRSV